MSRFNKYLDVTGRVDGIYLVNQPGTIASTAVETLELTLDGVVGDRHYGSLKLSDSRTPWYTRGTSIRNYRQVSIISQEELDAIAAKMGIPRILPEWLGANLLLSGIPRLTQLPPSTRIFFGEECVVAIDGENLPCKYPAAIIQENYPDIPGLDAAFPKLGLHLRGVVGWVERAGLVRTGDNCKVLVPCPEPYE